MISYALFSDLAYQRSLGKPLSFPSRNEREYVEKTGSSRLDFPKLRSKASCDLFYYMAFYVFLSSRLPGAENLYDPSIGGFTCDRSMCSILLYSRLFREKTQQSNSFSSHCKLSYNCCSFLCQRGIKKVLIITGVIRFYDEWDLFFSQDLLKPNDLVRKKISPFFGKADIKST